MATQGMTQFPGGFANGLSVRGMPLVQTQTGKVFWVLKSGAANQVGQKDGSDGNRGTYDAPFATIAGALLQCTANRGDVIMVKAGHTETISDAATLSLNVAGVAIIGLGSGSLRPTITLSTANTANIPITAANCSIQNILFKANFAAIASVFTATSTNTPTDFSVERCEFRDGSSSLNFVSIVTGNVTANSLDGLRFVGNRISSLGTTAATTAIKLLSANDRVSITDNFGNWAVLDNTACMVAAGANSQTNFDFGRNVLNKPNLNSTTGSFISTSATAWTGHCYDNYLWQLDGSAGIWIDTGTKLAFSNNFSPITGAADKSGLINPAAA